VRTAGGRLRGAGFAKGQAIALAGEPVFKQAASEMHGFVFWVSQVRVLLRALWRRVCRENWCGAKKSSTPSQ